MILTKSKIYEMKYFSSQKFVDKNFKKSYYCTENNWETELFFAVYENNLKLIFYLTIRKKIKDKRMAFIAACCQKNERLIDFFSSEREEMGMVAANNQGYFDIVQYLLSQINWSQSVIRAVERDYEELRKYLKNM
jgi:hypothetical protein